MSDEYDKLLDMVAPDPSGLPPMCDEPEFAAMLSRLAANNAPRLFAVMQEYGTRVDRRIAAWGMAFGDHAELVSVDRTVRMGLRSPENALRGFGVGDRITPRLVWVDRD